MGILDKYKKKATETVKKTAITFLQKSLNEQKKQQQTASSNLLGVGNLLKDTAKTVGTAVMPVFTPKTQEQAVTANLKLKEKEAAQNKLKGISLRFQDIGRQVTEQKGETPLISKVLGPASFGALGQTKKKTIDYGAITSSPSFKALQKPRTQTTIGSTESLPKTAKDAYDKQQALKKWETFESMRLAGYQKENFVKKQLADAKYAASMVGGVDDEKANRLRFEKEYDDNKKAAEFLGKVDEQFVKDLQGLWGKKTYEDMEKTAAWHPQRAIPRMLTAATFDVVDFEDLLQAGANTKFKQGQLWINGMPVAPEFYTEGGQEEAQRADVVASLVGSAGTYGGLSKGVGSLIKKGAASKIPTVKNTFQKIVNVQKRFPVLSEIAITNPIEETLEAGVRKGSGQEYSFDDFIQGLAIGSAFGGTVGWLNKKIDAKKIEKSLEQAEKVAAKTRDIKQVMAVPFVGNTLGSMWKETRFAYHKALTPGARPGIEMAAPLPEIKKAQIEAPQELRVLAQKADSPESFINSVAGGHRPPSLENGSPLTDLSKSYGEDIYSKDAINFFGNPKDKDDVEALKIIQSVKGNPDKKINIYRSVEKGAPLTVSAGDWVSLTENYAKEHGLRSLGKGFKIVKESVAAKDLVGNGDSLVEFGYRPDGHRDLNRQQLKELWDQENIPKQGAVKSVALPKTPLKTDNFAFLRGHKKTPRAGIDAPAPRPERSALKPIAETFKKIPAATTLRSLAGAKEKVPLPKVSVKAKPNFVKLPAREKIEMLTDKARMEPLITKNIETKEGKAQIQELKKIEQKRDVEVSDLVLPVEQALGQKQAQAFNISTRFSNLARKFKDRGISSKDTKEIADIFNVVEQPRKYSIPEKLQKKGIDDKLIQELRDYQKFLTAEQTKRGLLEKAIDPETYIKSELVQLDGSPLTKKQVYQLQNTFAKDFSTKLRNIQKAGSRTSGGGKFSLKKGGLLERKYKNADERDAALASLGVKTNRNIFEVLSKQSNDVSTRTASYDFVETLKTLAKKGDKRIFEVFDPAEIKNLKTSLRADLSAARLSVLERLKANKQISEEAYKAAKERNLALKSKISAEIKGEALGVKEVQKQLQQEVDAEFSKIKSDLLDLTKETKGIANFAALKEIEALKKKYDSQIEGINRKIAKKEIEAPEDFRPIGLKTNMALSKAVEGLRFSPQQAKAVEKIFQELDPNSLEDLTMGLKAAVATGDLFQLVEVVRQSFGTMGVKGLKLKEIMDIEPESFLKRSIDATRAGVIVGKPGDYAADLSNNLAKVADDMEKSFIAKTAGGVADFLGKNKALSFVGGATKEAFAKLERLQWETVVPRFKVKAWESATDMFQKKYPNLKKAEAEALAADFTNNIFQGVNWERVMSRDTAVGKMMSKRVLRGLRLAFFGPDRLSSVFFRYSKSLSKYGAPYRTFALRSMLTGMAVLQAMNIALNGHSTFENKKGSEFDLQIPFIMDDKGNPMAMNILGTQAEPFKFAWSPAKFVKNKRSLLFGVADAVKGGPYAPETLREAIWENAPIPITIKGLLGSTVEPFLGKAPKKGPQTGDTGFGTQALSSGLDFIGLPTTFRSGAAKTATIKDLMAGRATLWEYATSKDLPGAKALAEREARDIIKKSKTLDDGITNIEKEVEKLKKQGASDDFIEDFASYALDEAKKKEVNKTDFKKLPLKEQSGEQLTQTVAPKINKWGSRIGRGGDDAQEALTEFLTFVEKEGLSDEQAEALAADLLKKANSK